MGRRLLLSALRTQVRHRGMSEKSQGTKSLRDSPNVRTIRGKIGGDWKRRSTIRSRWPVGRQLEPETALMLF